MAHHKKNVTHTAQVLGSMQGKNAQRILAHVASKDPELAQELRQNMLFFDDLCHLSDIHFQKLLGEIPQRDRLLAFKGASPSMTDKFFRNLSTTMAQSLKEELNFLGPVKREEVEAAQKRVVDTARRLEAMGSILISSPDDKDVIY
ncbi:FliG C-terminal domain-containing protein [Magnetococcales bacterium HHB-1]